MRVLFYGTRYHLWGPTRTWEHGEPSGFLRLGERDIQHMPDKATGRSCSRNAGIFPGIPTLRKCLVAAVPVPVPLPGNPCVSWATMLSTVHILEHVIFRYTLVCGDNAILL
jgi:hypothetical protein